MRPDTSLPYRPELDSLRAVAVTLVLVSHFWWNDSGLGHLGVRLFFVLSGFLITKILLETPSLARFYARRFLRLAPAFYLALGFALLLDLDGMRATWPWHLLQVTNVLLAIMKSWGVAWPADHLWTLNVEEQFYLFWPMLILLLPRRTLPIAFATLIISAVVFRIVGTLRGWGDIPVLVLPPSSFDALAYGALMAVVRTSWDRIGLWFGPSLLIVAFHPFPHLVWLREIGEIGSVPALAALVYRAWEGRLGLSWRPIVGMGRISYGIYLYHGFVFGALAMAGLTERGPLLFATASLATLAISIISYRLVEHPIRRLGRAPRSTTPVGSIAAPPVHPTVFPR